MPVHRIDNRSQEIGSVISQMGTKVKESRHPSSYAQHSAKIQRIRKSFVHACIMGTGSSYSFALQLTVGFPSSFLHRSSRRTRKKFHPPATQHTIPCQKGPTATIPRETGQTVSKQVAELIVSRNAAGRSDISQTSSLFTFSLRA